MTRQNCRLSVVLGSRGRDIQAFRDPLSENSRFPEFIPIHGVIHNLEWLSTSEANASCSFIASAVALGCQNLIFLLVLFALFGFPFLCPGPSTFLPTRLPIPPLSSQLLGDVPWRPSTFQTGATEFHERYRSFSLYQREPSFLCSFKEPRYEKSLRFSCPAHLRPIHRLSGWVLKPHFTQLSSDTRTLGKLIKILFSLIQLHFRNSLILPDSVTETPMTRSRWLTFRLSLTCYGIAEPLPYCLFATTPAAT